MAFSKFKCVPGMQEDPVGLKDFRGETVSMLEGRIHCGGRIPCGETR